MAWSVSVWLESQEGLKLKEDVALVEHGDAVGLESQEGLKRCYSGGIIDTKRTQPRISRRVETDWRWGGRSRAVAVLESQEGLKLRNYA